jgi:ABC-type lipoprotein export system ATPase subunit
MSQVELRSVTKIYQTGGTPAKALDDVSLVIHPGEFVALVGKSGCGKSTLLNLCGAMDFPTSGSILIDGTETSRLDDAALTKLRREKIGFVFQSFQLLHTLTALENVELPIMLARKAQARAKALERLRWVEMESYSDRYPHQLSGGQQQRIAIARALAGSPQLLLADEPTGNLDSGTGELVLNLLTKTAGEFGVSIVMATHSMESAAVVNRTVRMRDGQIVAIETAEAARRLA